MLIISTEIYGKYKKMTFEFQQKNHSCNFIVICFRQWTLGLDTINIRRATVTQIWYGRCIDDADLWPLFFFFISRTTWPMRNRLVNHFSAVLTTLAELTKFYLLFSYTCGVASARQQISICGWLCSWFCLQELGPLHSSLIHAARYLAPPLYQNK